MATTITQAPNGRKSVFCDITGLGFTRIGKSLDAYQARWVPERLMVFTRDEYDFEEAIEAAQEYRHQALMGDIR